MSSGPEPRPRRLTRRRLVLAAGTGLGLLAAARCAVPRLLRAQPVRGVDELSAEARGLVELALEGIDPQRVWDVHVHLVGLGTEGSGCSVHPRMQSHLHPVSRLQFDVYMAASGVTDPARADAQYVERLRALAQATPVPGRLVLLPFDRTFDAEGREDPDGTAMHTPESHALDVAASAPEFLAAASVHPHRPDALDALDAAAARGAVLVKWLPNAMGIDPADARHERFYAKLAALDLPLLTHAGTERAVHAAEAQRLGNPLRLRRALDQGVRVIVAHCGSLGEGEDLDAAGDPGARERAGNFALFLRLMGESQYERNLFGDLSATTLVNRAPEVLGELLGAPELHPRLLYGSDYPLPAIDPIVSARQLARRGLLDPEERGPLEELQVANPLLGAFVLLRRVRVLEGGTPRHFSTASFETARVLQRS